jgi:hypothetical protein
MLKNLLTQNECRQIIHFHKTHHNLRTLGNGSDYKGIRFLHIQTPWVRQLIGRVSLNLICEIYKTQDKIVYPEMISINEWPIGGYQDPHLDTYSSESQRLQVASDERQREWTCILYLNDNFQGGQTYVPNGECYEPIEGAGLLFQGIYIEHGVHRVRRHPRHTISFWFSDNIDRCIPLQPIPDLSVGEESFRQYG